MGAIIGEIIGAAIDVSALWMHHHGDFERWAAERKGKSFVTSHFQAYVAITPINKPPCWWVINQGQIEAHGGPMLLSSHDDI